MELQVSQIDEYDGLTLKHAYTGDELQLANEEATLVGETTLRVHASREDGDILLRGEVHATARFECDRCLTAFTTPVSQAFDLLYVTAGGSRAAEEHELKEDDLSLAYYEGHSINLDDLVREQIELTLPMTHICSETCRGLCPQCGVNLNEGDCSCAGEPADSRWDALKQLKLDNR